MGFLLENGIFALRGGYYIWKSSLLVVLGGDGTWLWIVKVGVVFRRDEE